MKKSIKGYLPWFVIGGLLALVLGLFFSIGFKEESFEIKDRCGPIMNFISHTVQDESACEMRCKSQCGIKELKYSRVEFKERSVGCNLCKCFCKKSFFDNLG